MLDATAAFELDEVTALSLLEGCDLAEDVEAIPSSIVEPVSAPKARKRQCCRLARRDEVITLRKAEKQLCTQLRQLQLALRLKSRPDKKQLDGTLHTVLTWEEICHRQAARRAESEAESKKLRNEVQRRLWQAKQLLKGFKRRLRHEVVGSSIKLYRQYCVDAIGVTPPTDNDSVFHDLLLGMDELYAGVDDFFEKVKMDELPCPGRRNTTPGSRAEGKFVELLDCYAVPFGLEDTDKAVWRCLGEEEPQSPSPHSFSTSPSPVIHSSRACAAPSLPGAYMSVSSCAKWVRNMWSKTEPCSFSEG
ncbi:hypothetical protein PF005_g26356 [Phytophthora fragariae]|uniref:Uncharacterized protein n=1 Tax=Phytophthora fragariae TaxID=53985 RepID=A0A6A3HTB3_9STRA|nr:hypothetical protein PF003_g10943 [Phytophthora fragariae]KAE8922878.1 hypothetical protein PF009_g26863 [Phytophthora fragariae]KAE8971604.1 hypothetical protein PF011_g25975 [Phytophthora fragariae]KAE9068740.1 hypothetical protein PF007_g27569 [Phytophthora fragariae]KAE9072681.1 hypothetical protein PF010_g25389 [Phytophthora fragariae]